VNFPHWEPGGVSFFTQTGIFTGALMLHVMSSGRQRLPVGKSIDVGNKIDVDELDFLHYIGNDPGTQAIGLYIESVRRPDAFFDKARELRSSKPIVVLKPGRSRAGAQASLYHTGSLATDHASIEDALHRNGIPRAEDEDEFLNALRALVMLPRPRGTRVGVATTSGALGVIAADLLIENGLALASFAPATLKAMRSILPDWLAPANPFDFWIAIDVKGPREAHEVGLSAVFADPNVDIVLCTLLAPGNADFAEFGELMRHLRTSHDKPVALVIYGGEARERWVASVEGAGIPIYATTRAAVRALALMVQATS